MKLLLQRVSRGSVTIDGVVKGSIGKGFVMLLGVGRGDTAADVEFLAKKAAALRVFADEQGKLNLSIRDIGGEALVISQFTLYADTRRGNRPGFEPAAPPAEAKALYELFLTKLAEQGVPLQCGEFGADMKVEIINDGPVTIMLESNLAAEK